MASHDELSAHNNRLHGVSESLLFGEHETTRSGLSVAAILAQHKTMSSQSIGPARKLGVGKRPIVSEYTSKNEVESKKRATKIETFRYDFSESDDFKFVKLVSCMIGGRKYSEKNPVRLFCAIIETEIRHQNPLFPSLRYKHLCSEDERPFLMNNPPAGVWCVALSTRDWIQTEYSNSQLLERIGLFCLHCGYSEDEISIVIEGIRNKTLQSPPPPPPQTSIVDEVESSVNDDACISATDSEFTAHMTVGDILADHSKRAEDEFRLPYEDMSLLVLDEETEQEIEAESCFQAPAPVDDETENEDQCDGPMEEAHDKNTPLEDETLNTRREEYTEEVTGRKARISIPANSNFITSGMAALKNTLIDLLAEKFKYGFRLGSSIDTMKLRALAEVKEVTLPADDRELNFILGETGVCIGEKVYPICQSQIDDVSYFADSAFATGITALWTELFFEQNADWMRERGIVSAEVMQRVLEASDGNYRFRKNFFTQGEKKTESEAVMDEVYRVTENDRFIVMTDVIPRLPHVPADKILPPLTHCDNICWVSEGRYFKKNYFVVPDDEKARIREVVAGECGKNGFSSIKNLASQRLCDQYHDLPSHTIEQALYTNVLQDAWTLKGKILTPRNSAADGLKINGLLKAYCADKDICTVSEMEEYSYSLTGARNRGYVLGELYPAMIRVGRDLFISDDKISFDVDAIDAVLTDLVGERYATLKSIASFALFPPCGTTWNHFVLESFCYRFSRKYQLTTSRLNSKNAGIIVANGMEKPAGASLYEAILSEVLAEADIELTDEAAGAFLVEHGFAAKSKHAFLPGVLEEAARKRKGF